MARPCGGDSVSDDRVVLAAAHLDSDPTNNRLKNLRALCQRGHMLHDRPHHLTQRWITYRRRLAVGGLFLGSHPAMLCRIDQMAGFLRRLEGDRRRLRRRRLHLSYWGLIRPDRKRPQAEPAGLSEIMLLRCQP
jgi:hypothetical protein